MRSHPGSGASAAADGGATVQLLTATGVYAVLTALAFRHPAVGRRALGVFFLLTGLGVNGTLTVRAPDAYVGLARGAPWGWYRRIGLALTEPAPRVFGSAMALGETALAGAVLGRGRPARLGLLGVAVFSLGITPLGRFTLGNPVLALGAVHLARRQWPRPAFGRQPPARAAS